MKIFLLSLLLIFSLNVASSPLFCRVGAAMPVLFSFYVEFLAKEKRGRMITLLAFFWMFGNIMTSFLAWMIIPRVEINSKIFGSLNYGSWRIFVAVGAFPSLSSAVLFLFLPESPKFLLKVRV